MHGDDEGMVGDFGEDVSFGEDVFDVGDAAFEEAFGDDFHGADLGGVAVADLEDFAEGSHADDFEEGEVVGGYVAFVLVISVVIVVVIGVALTAVAIAGVVVVGGLGGCISLRMIERVLFISDLSI